jgi:hypothetical protein
LWRPAIAVQTMAHPVMVRFEKFYQLRLSFVDGLPTGPRWTYAGFRRDSRTSKAFFWPAPVKTERRSSNLTVRQWDREAHHVRFE